MNYFFMWDNFMLDDYSCMLSDSFKKGFLRKGINTHVGSDNSRPLWLEKRPKTW